ncbi:MAG: hypothetical protein NVSMB17_04240 [Candidatus Dormibacteria bacterium]
MRRATCRPLALVCLSLLLSGCGPHVPLEVSVKQVPVDIILGLQKVQKAVSGALGSLPPLPQPFAPPPPPSGPVQVGNGTAGPAPVSSVPIPSAAASPTPSPLPCPVANLLTTFPEKAATADLQGMPEPGVYRFRNGGAYQPDTNTSTGIINFPDSGTRTVTSPAALAPGIFTFDVVNTTGGKTGRSKVTTSFEVVPQNITAGTPGGQTVTQAAGIFITAITGQPADAPFFNFRPQPMITYLNLPVSFGVSWDTSGSDPANGMTLKLHGAIADDTVKGTNKGRRVVDACGTLVDTWEVIATGQLVGPNEKLAIGWAYDVATQYGGMTFAEVFDYGGQDNGLAGPGAHLKYASTSSVLKPGSN